MQRSLLEGQLIPVANNRIQAYRDAMSMMLQGQALREMLSLTQIRKIDLKQEDKKQLRQMGAAVKILKGLNFYDKLAAVLNA